MNMLRFLSCLCTSFIESPCSVCARGPHKSQSKLAPILLASSTSLVGGTACACDVVTLNRFRRAVFFFFFPRLDTRLIGCLLTSLLLRSIGLLSSSAPLVLRWPPALVPFSSPPVPPLVLRSLLCRGFSWNTSLASTAAATTCGGDVIRGGGSMMGVNRMSSVERT